MSDEPVIVVIAHDAAAAAAAEQAAAAIGERSANRYGWHEAAARIAGHGRLDCVMLEAAGVTDAVITAQLHAITTASDAPVIAVFGEAQIDALAPLLTTGATLLCAPGAADRAAALAVVLASQALSLGDASREAARLQRLNEEVARIAETLARLARRGDVAEAPPAAAPLVGDRATGFGAGPADIDAGEIRRVIRARRLRDETVGITGLFEDPGWDIMLDLFAAELERRQVSVSSLCIAAAVAPTTALRWITRLIAAGLLDRRDDAFDRRRAFIALTARGSTAMRNYVAAVRRAGLMLA